MDGVAVEGWHSGGVEVVQGDYKVGRCSRRCHLQDRPLTPGEWYYSVVTEGDEEQSLERIDISAQAWQGPPEGTVGWWKSRMPQAGPRKLKLAPDAVLVDLLKDVIDEEPSLQSDAEATTLATDRQPILGDEMRFLLALLLLRRRLVQPISEMNSELPWELEILSDGTRVTVMPQRFTPEQAKKLDEQITELLYCEAD